MKPSFINKESTMIVSVIRERTATDAIAAMYESSMSGAMGFDLHLSCLQEGERSPNQLESILRTTEKPVMVLDYNESYDRTIKYTKTDEERTDLLLSAVKAGASAVDLQGYTFETDSKPKFTKKPIPPNMSFLEANPAEVTLNPTAIQQQMEWIKKVHALGGEVILSTHTRTPMNCEQVVSLALFLENRGADLLKIVTPCENEDQLAECFKTTLKLKQKLHTKFSYHCCGSHGKMSRIICPMLGSSLIFCTERSTESSHPEQLPLKAMIDAFRALNRRI